MNPTFGEKFSKEPDEFVKASMSFIHFLTVFVLSLTKRDGGSFVREMMDKLESNGTANTSAVTVFEGTFAYFLLSHLNYDWASKEPMFRDFEIRLCEALRADSEIDFTLVCSEIYKYLQTKPLAFLIGGNEATRGDDTWNLLAYPGHEISERTGVKDIRLYFEIQLIMVHGMKQYHEGIKVLQERSPAEALQECRVPRHRRHPFPT